MGKIMVVSFQSLTATSGQGMARLGYILSKELHKRGLLDAFIVHSKGKFETPFPSRPVSKYSRYYLFLLNKLNNIFNFKTHYFRFLQEVIFDWCCARQLTPSLKIVLVTQPYLRRTFVRAQKLGIKTILISGTPEDNYMFNIVSEENIKLGSKEIDSYTYKSRNKYFNESMKSLDIVIGMFPTAYRTYAISTAFSGENIDMTGHMTPDFPKYSAEEKKPIGEKFVIGFLAYTVVLKGLHYLLEAWEQLLNENDIHDIELVVGGPMHPIVGQYIRSRFGDLKQVRYLGQVNNIAEFMKELDLFTVPSLIDGGPMTALEAAHYAVPILITDNAGSSELIERGKGGGYTVPIRDAHVIKEKILWAYNNKEENYQLGLNAKQNMDNYSFEDFIIEVGDYLERKING